MLSAGLAVVLLTGVAAVAGCGTSDTTGTTSTTKAVSAFKGTSLVGAGATFPAPVYAAWTQSFNKIETGAKINYQAVGSGGGIEQFTAKTVDFGATDVPLKDAEAAKITGSYVEFPTCLGAVVVSYNLKDVSTPLKLDGPTVADIFLGKITKWNDAAIAAQNSGVNLPATTIQIVHRADSSGTTSIFTNWLKGQSSEWGTKVGADKAVEWPKGQGGNGNAGVAAAMKQTEGSIGYMELQYAASTGLGVASIKASDGTYVVPSTESVGKAAAGLSFPISETTNILDSKTAGAYPISSATYILIYTEQSDKDKAQTVVDFWNWALTSGQDDLGALSYGALPENVRTDALAELAKVTVNGTAIAPTASAK